MPRSKVDKAGNSKKTASSGTPDENPSFAECRNEFIDRLAHDLKTPLFGTKEILQLVLNGGCGKIQPDLEALLLLVKQANEDLLAMTQRLIEIYRYETGPTGLELSQVDLIPMLKQVIAELQPMSKATETSLSCSTPKGHCLATIDALAIEQMLNYLLLNCIKHTASGGTLEIKLDRSKDNYLLTLTVTGLGITKSDLESIFLHTIRDSASQSYSALAGIELHLCRQIIHAHEGTIHTEKVDKKRLAIVVTFPVPTARK